MDQRIQADGERDIDVPSFYLIFHYDLCSFYENANCFCKRMAEQHHLEYMHAGDGNGPWH